MKKLSLSKLLFLFSIWLSALSASARQEGGIFGSAEHKHIPSSYYSYSPEGKVVFEVCTDKLLIKFKGNPNLEKQREVLNAFKELAQVSSDMMLPSPQVTVVPIRGKIASESDLNELVQHINKNPNIEYVNPFLVFEDGTLQAVTNRFMVKLNSANESQTLVDAAKQLNVKMVSQYKYDKNVYFLEVPAQSSMSALDVANLLYEKYKFSACEPDFLRFMKKFNTNDPFIDYQWALNNTGSPIQYNGTAGGDMKIFPAWNLSTGSNQIKVAIVDEGVDLQHPDLINNLLPGFDGTQQNSNGAYQGNDAHGTACAGIVAASANNSIGVAGIAYNCKIVPVRIAYSSGSNWVTSSAWIGTSIDWAWDLGDADVLSNSWGGGSSSALINDAITRAVTLGRNGLGAPVLFAAGNNNGAVSYPATQSNVISVVAMSMCNQRKSPSSCDGETWWGSNYGTNADISAPGVKIYTTDISGSAGYETGDYIADFNGTSSACPNAAGVMALILSANPNLTATMARQIIESSCDKVGGYAYNANIANQPNGTWSNEMGYGRVNAYNALQLINPVPCTGVPQNLTTLSSYTNSCTSNTVTVTLSSLPIGTGITYEWEQSPNNTIYNSISGANAIAYSTTVNTTLWYRCKVKCGLDSVYSTPVFVNFVSSAINTFPYTENFNTSTLPCGWSIQNVNADPNTYIVSTVGVRTINYGIRYPKNTTQAANDWLFSPQLNLTAGTNYVVRFWYKGKTVTLPEKLEVKWGASPNAAGMTSSAIFSNTAITNTTYTLGVTNSFSPTTSGVYYVGFRVFSDANKDELNIDDITFDIAGPCNTPLLGGTISGPSTIEVGDATTYTYSVVGNTGLDMQWQISNNNGTSWTNYGGILNYTYLWLPTTGNYLLRLRSSGTNCPDVYSNILPITVVPRVGDVFTDPINLVEDVPEYRKNGATSGYFSNYTGPNAQPSNDIYYKLVTSACADSLMVGTCGSNLDTYVHVLDEFGNHIYSMDDGPLCGQAAVFKIPVLPNTTYYLVAEGWNTSNGTIIIGYINIDSIKFTPTITVGNPSTICNGSSVSLTASGGVSYSWSNGDTGNTTNVNTAGTYTLTAIDANGCMGTATVTVSNAVSNQTYYADNDGDGYGDINTALTQCTQPVGYVLNSTDCDDNNAAIHTTQLFYVDADGDGFGSATTALLCAATTPSGYANNNTDCDDNNNAINTPQLFYVDADGDGFGSTTTALLCAATAPSGYANNNTDCDDNNNAINTPQLFYVDADGDGFGSSTSALLCAATAPSGYANNNTDCDDNNNAVNTPQLFYVDADGDGFGSSTTALLCAATAPSGYANNNTDCDDNNNAVNTPQLFYVDADGDGFGSSTTALLCAATAPIGYANNNTDCDDYNNAVNTPQLFYVDADGDGFGSSTTALLCASTAPIGYANNNTDCNDNDNSLNTPHMFYVDADGDGFGSGSGVLLCANSAPTGYSLNQLDCNDNYATINPSATEICFNGIDENCNGLTDENCCNISLSAITVNPTCGGLSNGNIDLTVNNATLPIVYSWSHGATSEDVSGLNGGNYTVTVTDANGCTKSTVIVLVNGNNPPTFPPAILGPSGACRNQTNVVFSVAPVPNATSYIWTLPTGATGSSTTNSISLNFSSTYSTGNICVRAVNACGQSSIFCRAIIRYTQAPAIPSVITGLSAGVCPSNTYSYSIPPVTNATSYLWTAPANSTISSGQGTTNVTVTYNANFTGSGTLSVRGVNCIGNGTVRNLTVSSTPTRPVSISGNNPVCKNASGVIFSVANNPAYTFTWTVPSSVSIVSGQGTNSVVVNWGANAGTISVKSNVSCASSANRSLNVTVTNCTSAKTIPGEEHDQSLFQLYPNPSSDQVTLEFDNENDSHLNMTLMDLQGKVVLQKTYSINIGLNKIVIPLNHIDKGIYIMRCGLGMNNNKILKLEIQ